MRQNVKKVIVIILCAVVLGGIMPVTYTYAAGDVNAMRLAGANRFETSFLIADQLKDNMKVEKFDCVIVSSGTTFADALPGSYLAAVKSAPIVLTNGSGAQEERTKEYIKSVIKPGGTVYILGGTSAVPASMEKGLDAYTVKRVSGSDRFRTNLEIFEAAGVPEDTEILVCTSKQYADSLSASATGKPILLVNKKLKDEQKSYLNRLSGISFCIVGGEAAVSQTIVAELSEYGNVSRLAGINRQETSVMVAQKYFPEAESAVLAYGWNYPDGLCGGPLAYMMKAPLILTNSKVYGFTASYTNAAYIDSGYVLGGSGLISDDAVQAIFAVSKPHVLNVKAEGYKGIYDGKAHSINVTCEEADITYALSESGPYSDKNPAYENAGKYTVFYKVEKEGFETVSGYEDIVIEKADGKISFSENSIVMGFEEGAVIDLLTESEGKMYAACSNRNVADVKVDGDKMTLTAKDEGTAVITVYQEAGTNYKECISGELTITVEFEDNILTVGEEKKYRTIQAAVDAAEDGDTVLVYPGTYKEAVDASKKTIAIRGMDKSTCILTYPNGDYYYPPLEMASGELKNLTINATAQAKQPGAVAKAYCLHTDYDILEGSKFYVENVDFVNADYQAVGIGLRGESVLEFVGCRFICNGDSNAIFFHDHVNAAKNQQLVITDCTFANRGNSYTIQIQAIEKEGSSVYTTWIDNKVTNYKYSSKVINMIKSGTSSGSGWMGSSVWLLTPDSMGNNISVLNSF